MRKRLSLKKVPLKKSNSQSNFFAGIMYLLLMFGWVGIVRSVVIFYLKRKDPFVKYHFKQWFVLVLSFMFVVLVSIPLLFVLVGFLTFALGLFITFVLMVFGMVYGFSGKQEPLPLIGKLGEKFDF